VALVEVMYRELLEQPILVAVVAVLVGIQQEIDLVAMEVQGL
jgi:hypothetical protein